MRTRYAPALPLLLLTALVLTAFALPNPALAQGPPLGPRTDVQIRFNDRFDYSLQALAAADLDGDGQQDLVTGGRYLTLLAGARGHVPELLYELPTGAAENVVLADLNGDGWDDLIAARGDSNLVVVLLNEGTSGLTFGLPTTFTAGQGPADDGLAGLAAADFDQDGHLDLAATSRVNGERLVLLPGLGDGTLGAPVTPPTPTGTSTIYGLTAADLDGDGRADLASGWEAGGRSLVVFLNEGAFAFEHRLLGLDRAGYVRDVVVADLDQDGIPDLAAATRQGAEVFRGTGGGQFADGVVTAVPGLDSNVPYAIDAADLDLDGDLDVALSHGNNDADGPVMTVLEGDGAGALTVWQQYLGRFTSGNYFYLGTGLALADLTGDQRPDVALLSSGTSEVGLYLNTSTAPPPPPVLSPGQWSDRFAAALDGVAFDVAVDGDAVFVGGAFATAGGAPARKIAVYDRRAGTWAALGAGPDPIVVEGADITSVEAVAVTAAHVYIAGDFESIGGVPMPGGAARWDRAAGAWEPLFQAVQAEGERFPIRALAATEAAVYVGGSFTGLTALGGTPVAARYVARLDPATRAAAALGAGIDPLPDGSGVRAHVNALALDGEALYAAGFFRSAGGQEAGGLARWEPSAGTWAPVPGVTGGIAGIWEAVHVSAGHLYVAGVGTIGVAAPEQEVARLARGGQTWEVLADAGTFVYDAAGGPVAGAIRRIAETADGRVIVGGGFDRVAGQPGGGGAAVWTAGTWGPLGGGLTDEAAVLYPSAYALAVVGDHVVVGGDFERAGGVPSRDFALYRLPAAPPPGLAEVQLLHASAALAPFGPIEVYLNQDPASTTPDAVVDFRGGTAFVAVEAGAAIHVRARLQEPTPLPGFPREVAFSVPPVAPGRYVVSLVGIPEQLLTLYAENPSDIDRLLQLLLTDLGGVPGGAASAARTCRWPWSTP